MSNKLHDWMQRAFYRSLIEKMKVDLLSEPSLA